MADQYIFDFGAPLKEPARTIHCRSCDRHLPPDAFRLKRIKPSTRYDTCRSCKSKYAVAWNIANPERVAATYDRLDKTRRALVYSKWQKANRAYLNRWMIEWRRKNYDAIRQVEIAKRSTSSGFI